MQTKLTLRLDDHIIEKVKFFASKQRMSLSKFTESMYLKYIQSSSSPDDTSIASKYSGILQSKDIDEDRDILEYLTKKHMK